MNRNKAYLKRALQPPTGVAGDLPSYLSSLSSLLQKNILFLCSWLASVYQAFSPPSFSFLIPKNNIRHRGWLQWYQTTKWTVNFYFSWTPQGHEVKVHLTNSTYTTHNATLERISLSCALELNIKSPMAAYSPPKSCRIFLPALLFTQTHCFKCTWIKNAELQQITYHLSCWSCTRLCWLRVCIWWGPLHTSYCTAFSSVC